MNHFGTSDLSAVRGRMSGRARPWPCTTPAPRAPMCLRAPRSSRHLDRENNSKFLASCALRFTPLLSHRNHTLAPTMTTIHGSAIRCCGSCCASGSHNPQKLHHGSASTTAHVITGESVPDTQGRLGSLRHARTSTSESIQAFSSTLSPTQECHLTGRHAHRGM